MRGASGRGGGGETYCIFSAHYPPHLGGIETFSINLARALVQGGDRVIVVTYAYGNDTGWSLEDGVGVYRLPCVPLVGTRFPVPRKTREYRALWSRLRDEPIDHIVINARFYLHTIEALRFSQSRGITPLVVEHGSAYLTFGSAPLDLAAHAYEHLITGMAKRFHPAFSGISQKSSEWLRRFGIVSKGELYCPFDAPAFRASSSGRAFREELGITGDGFLAVYAGRLVPGKGLDELLGATRSLEREHAGRFRLAIAGDGVLRQRLSAEAPACVSFLGTLGRDDLSALLQQAECFVLPSESEGFSMGLVEAAGCGCYVVSTDVGIARVVIPSKEYGALLSEGSAHALAQSLSWALEHPTEAQRCGERARGVVEERFSFDAVAARLRGLV